MEPRDLISALIQAGMTQAQIAVAAGLAQPTVSKIVRGDVRDVLSTTYRRLLALHGERIRPAMPAASAVANLDSQPTTPLETSDAA